MRVRYPLYSADPPRLIWPWMLIASSLAMSMVSAAFLSGGAEEAEGWLRLLGFRPDAVIDALGAPLERSNAATLLSLVSALFLHADWVHLLGNLAYLWVFGISVEKAVGHWRFLLLFLALGALANAITAWQLQRETSLAIIGSSGGVSAIIGVYLGLFPRRRMGLWLPLGLYLQFARLPAGLVIGSWFILQLLYSALGSEQHPVAWVAHLAGFLLGLLAAMLLRLRPATLHLHYKDD